MLPQLARVRVFIVHEDADGDYLVLVLPTDRVIDVIARLLAEVGIEPDATGTWQLWPLTESHDPLPNEGNLTELLLPACPEPQRFVLRFVRTIPVPVVVPPARDDIFETDFEIPPMGESDSEDIDLSAPNEDVQLMAPEDDDESDSKDLELFAPTDALDDEDVAFDAADDLDDVDFGDDDSEFELTVGDSPAEPTPPPPKPAAPPASKLATPPPAPKAAPPPAPERSAPPPAPPTGRFAPPPQAPAPSGSFRRPASMLSRSAAPPASQTRSAPPPTRSRALEEFDRLSGVSDEEDEEFTKVKTYTRRATVRYYSRMNPDRVFPLLVMMTREEVERVVKRHVEQRGTGPIQIAADSPLEIEPVLPGCQCHPPRVVAKLGDADQVFTFHVVPHVLGSVTGARVLIRQNHTTLAEVELDIRVVQRTMVVVSGLSAVVLPAASAAMKHFGLDFTPKDGSSPYLAAMNFVFGQVTPLAMTLVLGAVTVGLWWFTRPKGRDVFWDINPKPASDAKPGST